MASIGKRLVKAINNLIDGIPGELGKLNDDGVSYTVKVEGTLNDVYVRLFGDKQRTVTAVNLQTSRQARLPVRVRRNSSGRYEVIKADPTAAEEFLGEAAPTANIPPLVADALNIILNSDQFKPGRVRPLTGTDLQFIMEELPYPEILLGGADTILDIATEVGTIASGKKAWIAFSVDPATNVMTATNGADVTLGEELLRTDAFAISLPSGDLPLYAYAFQEGDTVPNNRPIDTVDEAYFVDLRPWITNAGGGGGSMSSFFVDGDSGTAEEVKDGDTLNILGGTGLSSVVSATDTVTVNLDNTAVTPASYTNTNLTVDAQGRITAASNGTTPAPTTAHYVTTEAEAALSNEFNLGGLTTGLLKHTVAAGASTPATAVAGTDYTTPTGTENLSNKTLVSSLFADYWRRPCRAVSLLTNVNIASAPASIDGVTLASGDRILLTAQSTPSQNGIWIFNGATNALTRPTDYVAGSTVWAFYGVTTTILEGTSYAGSFLTITTTGTITIDTTSVQWSIAAGTFFGLRLGSSGNVGKFAATLTGDRTWTFPDVTGNVVLSEGPVVLNDSSADVDIRFESNGDANNFFSDGGNDNVGIGTGTPDPSAKLQVVSTTKGSIPAPVMTAAEVAAISSPAQGLMAYESDTEHLDLYDGQRYRLAGVAGWCPYAYPVTHNLSADFAVATTLAANGGSLAVPVAVPSHMLLESVSIRNVNTALAREWAWDLYEQFLNNGNSGENTVTRVAASNGTDTFTPAAASNRTLAASSAPIYLAAGVYWLVIQCRHATNSFNFGTRANAGTMLPNVFQTKTTTNPNGATLDLVAATWTKSTDFAGIRLNGRILGQTTSF